MQKIKIRLPATLTDFGPGLHSLGLAIGMYAQLDVSPRSDTQLVVEASGEGAGDYPLGVKHPVVLGMMRVFEELERNVAGVTLRVQNSIPMRGGLGVEAVFYVGGMLAANNLLGNPMQRDDVLALAVQHCPRPDSAIASLLGGLTTYRAGDKLLVRRLPLTPFKLVVAIPLVEDYKAPELPEQVASRDALDALQRLPILLEALRDGDLPLLAQMLPEPLLGPLVQQAIPGYAHVAEIARLAGALGVTTTGGGPTLLFLAQKGHNRIAEAVEAAFRKIEQPARVLVLPVDTQGVVVSMVKSAGG